MKILCFLINEGFLYVHLNFASRQNCLNPFSLVLALEGCWAHSWHSHSFFFAWRGTRAMRGGHHMELWEGSMGSAWDQEKPSPSDLSYQIKLRLKLGHPAWEFTSTSKFSSLWLITKMMQTDTMANDKEFTSESTGGSVSKSPSNTSTFRHTIDQTEASIFLGRGHFSEQQLSLGEQQ